MAAVFVLAATACTAGSGAPEADDPLDAAGSPPERVVEWTGGSRVTIGGTLLLPGDDAVGAALLVPGFGAVDRNDVVVPDSTDRSADRLSQDLNYSRPGTGDPLLRDLAETFTAVGLATLRYDKRGSGRSQLTAGVPLSVDDLIADARAGLDLLARHQATAGKPLLIVAHDHGAAVAVRLAGYPGVRAVVLVSPFGRSLDEVIGDDLIAARGPVAGPVQADQLRSVAATLRAGGPLPAPPDLHGNLRALLLPFQEPYLREIFSTDPVAEAASVAVPALVARGGADSTTTAVDTGRLVAVLPAGSEELVVAGADHNLRVDGARDRQALDGIAAWARRHAAP